MLRTGGHKTLVVVGGPTASGKTSIAIALAKHFNTEIISADSRQFFQELNIGVARPGPDELQQVKHHFIAHKSITDSYSAGDFARDALSLLEKLFENHDVVVMAGGSGLFIKAVLEGFHDDVKDDGSLRQELETGYRTSGIEYLQSRLEKSDSERLKSIDLQNPHRLMRAIELAELTGKTFAERTALARTGRNFLSLELALDWPRQELYDRINTRVDMMMEAGLLEEVKSLLAHRDLNALQTVGYSELFQHLDGNLSLENAVDLIKQNTRRYAKRQLTWFRNKTESTWLPPNNQDVIGWVESQLQKS